MPKDLPDDPALLKQLLEQMLLERESTRAALFVLKKRTRCCASVCSDASLSKLPIRLRHS